MGWPISAHSHCPVMCPANIIEYSDKFMFCSYYTFLAGSPAPARWMNSQPNNVSNICPVLFAAVEEVKCKEAKRGGLVNKTHAYNQIIHALLIFMVEMNISGLVVGFQLSSNCQSQSLLSMGEFAQTSEELTKNVASHSLFQVIHLFIQHLTCLWCGQSTGWMETSGLINKAT